MHMFVSGSAGRWGRPCAAAENFKKVLQRSEKLCTQMRELAHALVLSLDATLDYSIL